MTDQPDIREQLAAFLAGELDDPAAEALQDRIDAEPWVAGLADEMADLLVELGGVDDVEPPAGFSAALRAGLEAEIGHALPGVDDPVAASGGADRLAASGGADRLAAPGGADRLDDVGRVAVLEAARPRGRRDASRPQVASGGRLRRALSIAAVLAVLGIGTVGVVTSFGGFGGQSDQATDDSGGQFADAARTADDSVALEAAPADGVEAPVEEEAADDAVADGDAADDAAASGPVDALEADATEDAGTEAAADAAISAAPAPDAPAVLDLGPVDDEQVLLDAVAAQPVVDALIGRPAADARELATAYRDELLRGPAFGDGTPAGSCLTAVLDAAGDDLVPAVALRADLATGPVVAYALVIAREGSGQGAVLDGVDVWVLQLEGCATQQVLRQR